MLGGLTRAFSKKDAPKEPELAGSTTPEPAMDAAPKVDLDMPLDPKLANRPLEPGSGAPDLNAIMKRVRDERSQPVRAGETDAGKSDFIAAARRAAQAAAAEADVSKRKSDVGSPVKALRIGDLLKSRRKPILMAATAIVTVLAGLQLAKTYMNDTREDRETGRARSRPSACCAAAARQLRQAQGARRSKHRRYPDVAGDGETTSPPTSAAASHPGHRSNGLPGGTPGADGGKEGRDRTVREGRHGADRRDQRGTG